MCIALWLFISYGMQSRLFGNLYNSTSDRLGCGKMGCLGLAVISLPVLAAGIVFLAGPLLRLAGVRPAWPIVLVGPAIALTLGYMYQRYFLDGALLTLLAASVGIAGSYAVAALLTMPEGHRFLRIGLAVAIVALLPLSLL
jgi:hypothetical protein